MLIFTNDIVDDLRELVYRFFEEKLTVRFEFKVEDTVLVIPLILQFWKVFIFHGKLKVCKKRNYLFSMRS